MKRWLTATLFALGILTWHAEVHAMCSNTTYVIHGRVTTCTVCCFGSSCTVNCN